MREGKTENFCLLFFLFDDSLRILLYSNLFTFTLLLIHMYMSAIPNFYSSYNFIIKLLFLPLFFLYWLLNPNFSFSSFWFFTPLFPIIPKSGSSLLNNVWVYLFLSLGLGSIKVYPKILNFFIKYFFLSSGFMKELLLYIWDYS